MDQISDPLDMLVTRRLDVVTANRFFCKLLNRQGVLLLQSVTDRLRSDAAALREVGL